MDQSIFSTTMTCAMNSWQIGVGDPGIMGWVIVVLYSLTGVAALGLAVRGWFPDISRARERVFWTVIGLILLTLAVNKQTDLQSLLTAFGRCLAQLQGWYEQRRGAQVAFILAAVLVMGALLVILWAILFGTMRRNGFALAGLIFVLGFVAIRAVGFHDMDRLINMELASFRLNWLFEMIGPTMILLTAAVQLGSMRRFDD